MKTEIIEKMLRCPICSEPLTLSENGKSLICSGARRHCHDIARSGYVNFASVSKSGDPKEAVVARRRFLNLGHYENAADMLCELTKEYAAHGCVIDAGCGEGYYSSRLAKDAECLCGFDLSRAAVEAASKLRTENAFYAVAGINDMPVKDECADAVVNVFAPCFEEEYVRALKKDGVLIITCAGPSHLMGLKRALYDTTPENTVRADLPQGMELCEKRSVSYEFTLESSEAIADLFSMTPYYYRTSRESSERLSRLERLTTEADFEFLVYRKKD